MSQQNCSHHSKAQLGLGIKPDLAVSMWWMVYQKFIELWLKYNLVQSHMFFRDREVTCFRTPFQKGYGINTNYLHWIGDTSQLFLKRHAIILLFELLPCYYSLQHWEGELEIGSSFQDYLICEVQVLFWHCMWVVVLYGKVVFSPLSNILRQLLLH